jgi:hypothetical protein
MSKLLTSILNEDNLTELSSSEFVDLLGEAIGHDPEKFPDLSNKMDFSLFLSANVFKSAQELKKGSLRQTSQDRIARFFGYLEAVISQQQFICQGLKNGESAVEAELDGVVQASLRLAGNFTSIIEEIRRLEGDISMAGEVEADFRTFWPDIMSQLPESYKTYNERIAEQIGLK